MIMATLHAFPAPAQADIMAISSPEIQAISRPSWSGRFSIQAQGQGQAFQANFELLGSVQYGELLLTSPLGNVVAQVEWDPEGATLKQDRQLRRYRNLNLLSFDLLGVQVPVAALFSWVEGQAEATSRAAGWRLDTDQFKTQGLISAQQFPVPPLSELGEPLITVKIILQR